MSLQAGTEYLIEAKGTSTLEDPQIQIYDGNGDAVSGAADNDSGAGKDAQLLFTPGTTGTYFIEASEHGGDDTGEYTVSISTERPPRFTSATQLSAVENTEPSFQIAAVDDDADDSVLEYAITGGSDAGQVPVERRRPSDDGHPARLREPRRTAGPTTATKWRSQSPAAPAVEPLTGTPPMCSQLPSSNATDEPPGRIYVLAGSSDSTLDSIEVAWVPRRSNDGQPITNYQVEFAAPGSAGSKSADWGLATAGGIRPAGGRHLVPVPREGGERRRGRAVDRSWLGARTDDCSDDTPQLLLAERRRQPNRQDQHRRRQETGSRSPWVLGTTAST